MTRIGMGLVGAGFVGPHHVDAVRRLGFVDIVAVAGSNEASGQQKAQALGARRGYGSYRALIEDPDVQVVHNTTPNHLHAEVTLTALAAGKHVVSVTPRRESLEDLFVREVETGDVGAGAEHKRMS